MELSMPTAARQKKAEGTAKIPPLRRSSEVAQAFQAYPATLRRGLISLRKLVFTAAAQTPEVGELTETLRWGVPSYLTAASRSGTTIRLGVERKTADHFGLYVPCQTTLIADFRQLYGNLFSYSGKRALLFEPNATLPEAELLHCITLAFTYHNTKRRR